MSVVPQVAFALVLLLASTFAALIAARARPFARDALRFAAALYAALACASLIAALQPAIFLSFLAGAVALFVAALAPAALAIALASTFARRPHTILAALLLVMAALAGLLSAMTNIALLAFAPLFVSVCAMLALVARAWRTTQRPAFHAAAGALALLLGASAFMTGGAEGRMAFVLFSAAGLIGISLALARGSRDLVQRETIKPLRAPLVTSKS